MSLVSTSGIRGPVGQLVTADLAVGLGQAIASRHADRVVVGHDPRETSGWLVDALTAGLRECGADVVDVGLAATPTVARSVGWLEAELGIVVTASHNPPEYNGFKLWNSYGQAVPGERIAEILESIDATPHEPARWNQTGGHRSVGGMADRHVEAITSSLPEVDGLEVVVDVGNGAGGVAIRALAALGADVTPVYAEPDGRFPNRPSEPTADACGELRKRVARTSADLGVALDGDADRMMAVTESGAFVLGDVLLAMFARDIVRPGERIAAPLNTSLAVDRALAPLDASVSRTAIGDIYVAERTREPDVVFGGEPSGAWIFPEETRCPDGPLAACRLATMVDAEGSFDDALAQIETYPLRRDTVQTDAKYERMDEIRSRVQDRYGDRCTTLDGVHVEFDDGWFLIRPSGTEPLIRLTAEGETETRADELLREAERFVHARARS